MSNTTNPLKWVKASERLPERCGESNSVIIKSDGFSADPFGHSYDYPFVTTGFVNFDEKTPRLYFLIGNKSFLTNENIYWLEEQKESNTDCSVDGWIDARFKRPKLKEGEDYSENVLAICNGSLMVMAWCYIEADEDSGFAWCNCNGDIYGEAEFDDEYIVTHWQPLPTPPNTEQLKQPT